MEIKVKCGCGSTYSFEEVPVGGRLAFPISCTNCGTDGTAKANDYIARKLAGEFEKPAKSNGLRGWLPLGRKKDEWSDEESPRKAEDENGDEASAVRIALAMLGTIAVGAGGAFGWLELAKATGFEFGYAAWAIGGMVGGASRLFAPRGHYWLGPTAALMAFLSIAGGQVLVTNWMVGEEVRKALPLAYEETRAYAEAAVNAESDDELRVCMARHRIPVNGDNAAPASALSASHNRQLFNLGWTLYGVMDREPGTTPTFKQIIEASDPDKISIEEVVRFRNTELPELKAFWDGNPSKAEYESTLKEMIYSKISLNNLVTESIRPYSLLWVALGLYTAYKLARNAGLSY